MKKLSIGFTFALFLGLSTPVSNAAEDAVGPAGNRSDREISQRVDADDPSAIRSRDERRDQRRDQRMDEQDRQVLPPDEMPSASEENAENADKEGDDEQPPMRP
jgi:hypothetical protein